MATTIDLNQVLDYIIQLVASAVGIMRTEIIFRWHGFSISLFQVLLSFLVLSFFFSVVFPHVYPDDEDDL